MNFLIFHFILEMILQLETYECKLFKVIIQTYLHSLDHLAPLYQTASKCLDERRPFLC